MSSGVVTGPALGTGIINTDQVTRKQKKTLSYFGFLDQVRAANSEWFNTTGTGQHKANVLY